MRPQCIRRNNRQGGATVEFAICAPILFMFLCAVVEFGSVYQLQQTVREAAFEGARAGVALDAATSDVTTAATSITQTIGIINPTITINPNPLTYTSPTITVTVSVNLGKNAWLLWFFSGTTSISGTITLTREVQGVSVPF